MRRKRYAYLIICLTFLMSVFAPAAEVLAESTESEVDEATEVQSISEGNNSIDAGDEEPDTNDNEQESDEAVIPPTVVYEGENGEVLSNILIKSYNPGFSDPYIGEFFELTKLSKNSILLAGLSVIYETSKGSEYLVYEFLEGHEMVGESLLLRLAGTEEVTGATGALEVADATYTRNMSQSAGRIKLKYKDRVIDSLCWGLKETGCYPAFAAKKPTSLVRVIDEEEIGDFEHMADYKPAFDAESPGLRYNEPEEEEIEPKCRQIEFSEIFTYYESASTEQFVELYNRGEEAADITGCFIRYKNNTYALTGTVAPQGFAVFRPVNDWRVTLTKNPASSNKLEIVDTDGEVVDYLMYYSGQKRGLSLAMFGYKARGSEKWEQTYNPTPGADNNFQQFKTCPAGKVINLETGNCVNETAVTTTLAACPAGKYRNPLTGRCKSYATTASTELKPCAEGYERNPETNRCRKVVANTGASYPVATGTYEDKKEFVSIWTIATVIVAGLGYIAFQYKDELKLKFAR